ncbi:MAG: isoleucine--tRNA ligase [Terriglobales bacterium]
MKANLPQNEPKMLARWEDLGIYERIREARKGAPMYVLHDGPPYANGPIHLGHALNKSLKDFVVKSKTMAGFDSPYIPGWDCHGLPIEIKVDEALGRKKLEMDPAEVRKACRQYAEKYVDLQRSQFKRIGVFGRWNDPYLTMTPQYEATVVETLYRFVEQGAIYKGLRPVYWCIFDKTALAEAEVEYENHTSPSVWVKYRMTSDPAQVDAALAGKTVNTIIWTTTPWTLPASMAVAFHPDEEYVALVPAEGSRDHTEVYIVAAKLAEEASQKCGLTNEVVARFPGRKLDRVTFAHPFLDRSILGVLADYVTMDQGTGAVHTAPAHGADDFYTGVKYGIDQTCNVDEAGRLRHGLPEYEGQTVFKANEPIVELLKSRGVLMHRENIEHSYPHCWRCHNPVIFRATEQWFISMEAEIREPHPSKPGLGGPPPVLRNQNISAEVAEGQRTQSNVTGETPVLRSGTLRQRALDEIKATKWDPGWGEERISNMIATRPDWCISRQRVWGVPIAMFFCEGCNEFLQSPEVNRAVVELFRRAGADAWYTTKIEDILPTGSKCQKCGGAQFRKEMDIIDVWFESGSSYLAVQGTEAGLPWPSDLYIEGGDQYRGWFHSSLLCSIGARNQRPYNMVSTNGWTLDMQGRAMSKSLNNGVDPVEVAEKMGAEIVRLWVSSVDFREDVRADDNLMKVLAENYRKFRNTFRYVLSNLYDFDPAKDVVAPGEMEFLDRVMLLRTAGIAAQCLKWYADFSFHRIYQALNAFCNTELSAIYFDILKDRLYTYAPKSKARRSAQTAIWMIGEALVRLLAPVLSFTADEVWRFLPAMANREASVHLALFADPKQLRAAAGASDEEAEKLLKDWADLQVVRDEVQKALESARDQKLIGKGLEAEVEIQAPPTLFPILERHRKDLRYLFLVSGVQLGKATAENGGSSGIQVKIRTAPGQKCERCWNYSIEVGKDAKYPTVCERCSEALREIGP